MLIKNRVLHGYTAQQAVLTAWENISTMRGALVFLFTLMFLFGVLGANMPFLSFRICWFQETELFGRPTMFQMLCTLVSLFWLFCQHLFFSELGWGGGGACLAHALWLVLLILWYHWDNCHYWEAIYLLFIKISWIISPQFHYVES